jgi:expansin (peptidoglycan-binding protein)
VTTTGSSGSVIAIVSDQCAECVDNHLDLDNSFADQVDANWATKGMFYIQGSFVLGPVSGALQFKSKEGKSAY